MKIDAHQHFWKFDPVRDSWITAEMNVLRKDFLPPGSFKQLSDAGIDGCVAVQADQSEKENEFLLSLANKNDFIKAVVGWVDFCADDISDRLQYYSTQKKIKGFRHILQSEHDRAFMLQPAFMNGISMLQQYDFSYDILIFPDQLKYIPQFVRAFPQQKFVIDHLAKPDIKRREIIQWKKEIIQLAQYENVFCKVSGLVTEADWKNWTFNDLKPYLDIAWESFGSKRVMFGSDYPVCLLASDYKQWVDVMIDYTATFSVTEKEDFWGGNAARFYNIH